MMSRNVQRYATIAENQIGSLLAMGLAEAAGTWSGHAWGRGFMITDS